MVFQEPARELESLSLFRPSCVQDRNRCDPMRRRLRFLKQAFQARPHSQAPPPSIATNAQSGGWCTGAQRRRPERRLLFHLRSFCHVSIDATATNGDEPKSAGSPRHKGHGATMTLQGNKRISEETVQSDECSPLHLLSFFR